MYPEFAYPPQKRVGKLISLGIVMSSFAVRDTSLTVRYNICLITSAPLTYLQVTWSMKPFLFHSSQINKALLVIATIVAVLLPFTNETMALWPYHLRRWSKLTFQHLELQFISNLNNFNLLREALLLDDCTQNASSIKKSWKSNAINSDQEKL